MYSSLIKSAFITKFKIKLKANKIILIDLGFIGSEEQNVYDIFCFSLKFSHRYSQNVLLSLTIASSYSKSSKQVARYSSKNSLFFF